jgi:uncharacterized protein YciI
MKVFAITGLLNPDAEHRLGEFQEAFNEHIAQPFRRILLGGPLRGADGRRSGFMVLIEAESFERAEAFLSQSPLFQAGMYQRTEIAEFVVEVGRLD